MANKITIRKHNVNKSENVVDIHDENGCFVCSVCQHNHLIVTGMPIVEITPESKQEIFDWAKRQLNNSEKNT